MSNVNYTFPSGAAIPVNYSFTFSSFDNLAGLQEIFFSNAPLNYGSVANRAYVFLPVKCVATFMFDGGVWNIVSASEGFAAANP